MSPEHHEQLRDLALLSHQRLFEEAHGEGDAFLQALLDGDTTDAINALLGREHRRADGIFFSGPAWAEKLREALPHGPFERFVDPSCGIGDLLVEVARHLPLGPTLAHTVTSWSRQFHGMDLHGPLAQMAWYRLQALAMRRHGLPGPASLGLRFTGADFIAGDALAQPWQLRAGDCILMNPPFHAVASPAWTRCTSGRVSAAALFLERALTDAPNGATIVALVPEALRSGTRFAKLRDFMRRRGRVHQFTACGRFSHEADIDVAVVAVTIGPAQEGRGEVPAVPQSAAARLCDVAQINVGSIVPHRDPKTRTSRLYLVLSARNRVHT